MVFNLKQRFFASKPKASQLSNEERHSLRMAWFESTPLVTCRCGPDRIEEALAGLSRDDLHALAHGESLEDGTLAEAVVKHPLCDLGTAFEVVHSYSAASYQSYWDDGRTEDDFGEGDQALFRAFSTVAHRATNGGFKTRLFRHNLDLENRPGPDGAPDPYYPSNWTKWRLPEAALKPTKGARPSPSVSLEGGRVLPSFESWLARHGRLQ